MMIHVAVLQGGYDEAGVLVQRWSENTDLLLNLVFRQK